MFRLGSRWGRGADAAIRLASQEATAAHRGEDEANRKLEVAVRHRDDAEAYATTVNARLYDAIRERDEATQYVTRLRAERNAAVIEAQNYGDLTDRLAAFMPESWDGDSAFDAIVVEFVAVLAARLAALGGSSERWQERPDGSVFPDARTDPNGYADAVAEWRRAHSGCRCPAFGEGTPEHAPSVLCKPRPGDRPAHSADYGACGVVTPDGPCNLRAGHPEGPYLVGYSGHMATGREDAAWTVHVGAASGSKAVYFTDAQHYDTACEDRPHCTIVEHHATDG
jgi:hypothetical protein